MGPAAVLSGHHGSAPGSGDIFFPHHSQPDVPALVRVADGGLTMEEGGSALIVQTAIGIARLDAAAITAAHLADVSPPAATVAHTGPPLAKVASGVLHISPSAPRSGTAGRNSYAQIAIFGGPANSESPVALRPTLARGLPFRLLSGPTMTV